VTTFIRSAPAKLNLTLEILGRRADGYHELRSVVTTLSLADEITVGPGAGLSIGTDAGFDSRRMQPRMGEVNTVERALALLRTFGAKHPTGQSRSEVARGLSLHEVAIGLHKRIPAAAGLGGGSSDAVTVLDILNQECGLGLNSATLCELAVQIGSDCPFFVRGGVQLMSGRGEELQELPPHREAWFCVATPEIYLPKKTATLYSLVGPEHYSKGRRTEALVARLNSQPGYSLQADDLSNDFDRHSDAAFGPLEDLRARLRAQGARAVHLCGSGPSLYGLFPNREVCEAAEGALRALGVQAWAVSAPV
jgi:4-diphosphocytidyl-2-C-methyl-D-erythritol kinase